MYDEIFSKLGWEKLFYLNSNLSLRKEKPLAPSLPLILPSHQFTLPLVFVIVVCDVCRNHSAIILRQACMQSLQIIGG
jgi:hypothetical protein